MTYNIHYDVAALALSLTALVHFLSKKNILNLATRLFSHLLWLSFSTCALDIITAVLADFDMPGWFVYVSNEAYLILFCSIPYVYFLYIIAIISKRRTWSFLNKVLLGIPFFINVGLILTTSITHWIFYNDPVTRYTHGPYYKVMYLFAFCYMFVALLLTGKFRSRLTYSELLPIIFYNIGVLGSIIIQTYMPDILILQYVGALSILLMYLSLENPHEFEDKDLGVFNRRGFMQLVNAAIQSRERFAVIGVRFNGYQSIRETLGAENRVLFIKEVADFVTEYIAPHKLCIVADGSFVIFAKEESEKKSAKKGIKTEDEIVKFIQDNFNSAVRFRGMEIVVSASLFSVSYPDDIQSLEDILDTIDYASEHIAEQENGVVLRASEDILQQLRRNNKIELIMKRALANDDFDVYYQPIYSVARKRFCSAEALLRLKDEEMGFISPEEFIPIAEKNGMIFEIGELVFRKVCAMIARERLWEKGIDYIEVNLSPVQCIEEGLHTKLFAIMDEYSLAYDLINLEITETATVSSEEVLRRNIEPLLINGVTFSLDDYGTGYSNISNVISYPFHIIKIDKSMVWFAMEDERAMRALRHTVAMIKDLDINIVAEGVETLEQAGLLENLGCNYLQGYYFSKPVPEKDFVKMV